MNENINKVCGQMGGSVLRPRAVSHIRSLDICPLSPQIKPKRKKMLCKGIYLKQAGLGDELALWSVHEADTQLWG